MLEPNFEEADGLGIGYNQGKIVVYQQNWMLVFQKRY